MASETPRTKDIDIQDVHSPTWKLVNRLESELAECRKQLAAAHKVIPKARGLVEELKNSFSKYNDDFQKRIFEPGTNHPWQDMSEVSPWLEACDEALAAYDECAKG